MPCTQHYLCRIRTLEALRQAAEDHVLLSTEMAFQVEIGHQIAGHGACTILTLLLVPSPAVIRRKDTELGSREGGHIKASEWA